MPIQFMTKEALLEDILNFYRQEAHRLSGPREAVTERWPVLVRQIAREVLILLAQERMADLVRYEATHGHAALHTEGTYAGTLTVTQCNALDATQPPQIYQVPIQRTEATVVQVIVPTILRETVYVTETVAKPLLAFTAEDFTYCLARHAQQREGLTRRIAAMQLGASLLQEHHAPQVDALPQDALDLFAARWREAVKGTGNAAAD